MTVHLLPSFYIINRFLEDTCVLATVAYLLSRGTLLSKLFAEEIDRRDLAALALVFGCIGGSELIFPGDRYPYIPVTLAVSFAAYAGGFTLGLLTASVMEVFYFIALAAGLSQPSLLIYTGSMVVASIIGGAASKDRPVWQGSKNYRGRSKIGFLLGAVLVGGVSETPHAVLLWMQQTHADMSSAGTILVYSIVSNAFGSFILGIVLWDAYERQLAIQKRIRAEMELASLRLGQLGALQARLHPHFLFNALAGLAGLCTINPEEAERGITNLAKLLRQLLRAPSEICIPLREEISVVRTYLAIEQLRLEDRLCVHEEIPKELMSAPVPRFSLQVPVENAVQHGIAPALKPCQVRIVARRRKNTLLLAVCDNGVGVHKPNKSPAGRGREEKRSQGLELLAARLDLTYGKKSRLRLFSRPGRGTIAVIILPLEESEFERSLS